VASSRQLGNGSGAAHSGLGHILKAAVAALLVFAVAEAPTASASNGIDGEYYLQGIGYREQELQVSKTTRFASEEATGVAWASYAGGTHIFIKGVGFVKENPEGHSLKFVSHEFGETVFAPPMT
jgi:hypothetical protein